MFQVNQVGNQTNYQGRSVVTSPGNISVGEFSETYFSSLLSQESANSLGAASLYGSTGGDDALPYRKLDFGEGFQAGSAQNVRRASSSGEALAQSVSGRENDSRVYIGKITDKIPTVSELLYASGHKKECWDILSKDVNGTKPFRRIQPGTDIYLDRNTSEIVWGKDVGKKETEQFHRNTSKSDAAVLQTETKEYGKLGQPIQDGLSAVPLNHAVSKFIGKDYNQMDCYEMVVEGLKEMGVSYQGRNGLGRYLMEKAAGEGLSSNHYLNGEGLVNVAGESVYHKRVLSVKNPKQQAQTIMNEMEKVLKTGQILSFSTKSQGHTGVVSKQQDTWTFINSGTMDNSIAGKNGSKGVGEEILSKELENWLQLAGKKNVGLQITLGGIDASRLALYKNGHGIGQTLAMSG